MATRCSLRAQKIKNKNKFLPPHPYPHSAESMLVTHHFVFPQHCCQNMARLISFVHKVAITIIKYPVLLASIYFEIVLCDFTRNHNYKALYDLHEQLNVQIMYPNSYVFQVICVFTKIHLLVTGITTALMNAVACVQLFFLMVILHCRFHRDR